MGVGRSLGKLLAERVGKRRPRRGLRTAAVSDGTPEAVATFKANRALTQGSGGVCGRVRASGGGL